MLSHLQRSVIRLASEDKTIRSELLGLLGGYKGNPDGQDIYENEVDHGYGQALSGGHDIMKRLVDRLNHEQGRETREPNPRLASRGQYEKPLSEAFNAIHALNSTAVLFQDTDVSQALKVVDKAMRDVANSILRTPR